jgi:hypothetical protein
MKKANNIFLRANINFILVFSLKSLSLVSDCLFALGLKIPYKLNFVTKCLSANWHSAKFTFLKSAWKDKSFNSYCIMTHLIKSDFFIFTENNNLNNFFHEHVSLK